MHAPAQYDYAIVGGGFAGLATGYFLARAGKRGVIIEKEVQPASHASGRNAALFMQLHKDMLHFELASRSSHLFDTFDKPLLNRTGSLLLTHEAKGQEEVTEFAAPFAGLRATERLTRHETLQRFDFMQPGFFSTAVYNATDGVIDIHGLRDHFIHGATTNGFELKSGCEVTGVDASSAGVTLHTSQGEVCCTTVINSAGAWAEQFGRLMGADSPQLIAYKRHLCQMPRETWLPETAPFVWHLDDRYYFRVTEGASSVLASICDETPTPPGDEANDPQLPAMMQQRLQKSFKPLGSMTPKKIWACQRTFSADKRPVVGWDTKLPWLFWMAGLGSSGATSCAALGEFAATLLLAGPQQRLGRQNVMNPARF